MACEHRFKQRKTGECLPCRIDYKLYCLSLYPISIIYNIIYRIIHRKKSKHKQ